MWLKAVIESPELIAAGEAVRQKGQVSCWLRKLIERRGYKWATVELAAQNARLIWVLLFRGKHYRVHPAAMEAA